MSGTADRRFMAPRLSFQVIRRENMNDLISRQAHWIPENKRPKSMMWQCSACREVAYFPFMGRRTQGKECRYKYCPHCGVKMDVVL